MNWAHARGLCDSGSMRGGHRRLVDTGSHERGGAALKVAAAVAVFVVFVLALYLAIDYWGKKKWEEVEAQARAKGIPVYWSELEAQIWGPDGLPVEENAAVYYEAAFSLMRVKPGAGEQKDLPIAGKGEKPEDPREPLARESLEAAARYVKSHELALAVLREGARYPRCKFTVEREGAAILLGYLSHARASARLLALAVLVEAEEGDAREGVGHVADMLALGRAVRQEPRLISNLTSFAIDAICADVAGRLLSRTNPSDEELLLLQGELEKSAAGISPRNAFLGELAGMNDNYERVAGGRARGEELQGEGEEPGGGGKGGGSRRPSPWGIMRLQQARRMEELIGIIEAVSAPSLEMIDESRFTPVVRKPTLFRRAYWGPAFGGTVRQYREAAGRLRAGAAAVAALRFRNEEGRWPERLEEMAPGYIKEVPIDPFTGNTLAYKVTDDGILVYSVGADRWDDEGRPRLVLRPEGVEEREWEKSGDDRGVRVWR